MVTKNQIRTTLIAIFISLCFGAKAEDAKTALQKDIAVIESIIYHNNLEKAGLLNEIQNTYLSITASERVIRLIIQEEEVTDAELANMKTEVISLEQEVKTATRLYQKLLLEEYKYRDYKSKLVLLVSSKSINQFLNRLRHLERLKSFRIKRLKALKLKKEDLTSKILVYEGSEEEKQELVEKKQVARSKLKYLIEQQNTLLREVEKENNLLQMRLNETKEKLQVLENKVRKEVGSGSGELGDFQKTDKLNWPVKRGLVVGKFGVQNHTTIHKIKIENNGIDILLPRNEEVTCVEQGVVKSVFEIPGTNYSIIIDHGSYYSVYSNVRNPLVREGLEVKRGTQLATIALNDENLFKLHFELWKGTQKVNPLDYLTER